MAGEIVFRSNYQGNQFDLYSVNVDTLAITRLTNSTNVDREPRWSPDGTQVAYARFDTVQDQYDLWVLDVVTGDSRQVTFTNGWDEREPVWSPDGRYLVYRADEISNQYDLYRVNLETLEAQRLTETLNAGEYAPDWFAP